MPEHVPESVSVPPERLRESLAACMDSAEDALLLRADQATSSASQNRYFEVLGDLRHQRRALVDDFFACWEELAASPEKSCATPSDAVGNHAARALDWLDELAPVAASEYESLIAQPRYRHALAAALCRQSLRPEGQLSLLKAIEGQSLAGPADPQLQAWLDVLLTAPADLPVAPDAALAALQQLAGQDTAEIPAHLREWSQGFLRAWHQLCAAPGLPDPARQVLARLRMPLLAAGLLAPGWFRDGGCALQLLDDLLAVLPGLERGVPPLPPILRRSEATLASYPERVPGVWMEWRVERERRNAMLQEWLAALERDARDAERVRVAEKQVRGLYEERLLGASWPREALNLLEAGWSEVLMLAFLHPDDTDRMGRREAIRLLDQLLDSVRADLPEKERQAIMGGLVELMRHLRAGLEQTGMDAAQVNELLHGLRFAHGPLVFQRGAAQDISWCPVDEAWLQKAFSAARIPSAENESTPEQPVQVGDWVEFQVAPASGLHRFRVVQVVPAQNRVALFNELQVEQQTMCLATLREHLQTGDARLLPPLPAVETLFQEVFSP